MSLKHINLYLNLYKQLQSQFLLNELLMILQRSFHNDNHSFRKTISMKAFYVIVFLLLNTVSWCQAGSPLSDLKFTQNKGQWHKDILYRAPIPGGTFYLTPTGFATVHTDQTVINKLSEHNHSHDTHTDDTIILPYHFIRANFIKGNSDFVHSGQEPTSGVINYLIGPRENWSTDIRSFQRVSYKEIYKGISFEIFKSQNSLKYQYTIAPRANPNKIGIEYTGQDSIYLSDGVLHIRHSLGETVEEAPFAYQIISDQRIEITCKFVLKRNVLTFEVGRYNKKYPLIIDPQLIFSTSSGSTADNWGNTACLDSEGNLYSGGTVFPSGRFYAVSSPTGFLFLDYNPDGFPTTPGAFQDIIAGDGLFSTGTLTDGSEVIWQNHANISDMAFMKFDSSGTNLLYATYLGGTGVDVPISINTTTNDELIILGVTGSSDFPGAVNTLTPGSDPGTILNVYRFSNGADIVVTKLNAAGNNVINSYYAGGTSWDGLMRFGDDLINNYGDELRGDIIEDTDGSILCASYTRSPDFPSTLPSLDSIPDSTNYDGLILNFQNDLSALNWSTTLGGSGDDALYSIKKGTDGFIYVAGGTTSPDLPTDSTSYQTYMGDVDGFAAKIAPDGSRVEKLSYVGTPAFDQSYFLDIDEENDVYLFGQTRGSYPVSDSVYSNQFAAQFLHKLGTNLDTTYFSTVFGSPGSLGNVIPNISPTAFLVNDCENMFVSGWGGSDNQTDTINHRNGFTFNMPLINETRGEAETDGSDFYLAVIQKDAKDIIFGTYFGGDNGPGRGEHVDGGTSRFDKQGIVYQSVCAGCGGETTFPTFPDDGLQSTYPKANASGNCNNAVFKYDLSSLEAILEIDDRDCGNKTVKMANNSIGGIDYTWIFGDGDTLFIDTKDSVTHRYQARGEYLVQLIARDLTTCTGRDTATATIIIGDSIFAEGPDTICFNESAQLLVTEAINPVWDVTPELTCSACHAPIASPTLQSTTYYVRETIAEDCIVEDSVTIFMFQDFSIDIGFADRPCQEDTVLFINNSESASGFIWSFGDGSPDFEGDDKYVIHQYTETGTYTVTLFGRHAEPLCSDSAALVQIEIQYLDSIYASGEDTLCLGQGTFLQVDSATNPVWVSRPDLSCVEATGCKKVLVIPTDSTYYVVFESLGEDCIVTDSVKVLLHPVPDPKPSFTYDNQRCWNNPFQLFAQIDSNDCICCEPVSDWIWDFGDGNSSEELNPIHQFEGPGTYDVTLFAVAWDTVEITNSITVMHEDSCLKNIYIPNAFTPNGDGENDLLYVRAVNLTALEFHLYNHWGEEVFTTNSLWKGWDAIYKGVKQTQQVFTYTCNATFWDGEDVYLEGNVTLIE